MQYLNLLQQKLGFNCTTFGLFEPSNNSGTSFTAFIYHLNRCSKDGVVPKNDPECQCDIGVAGFGTNEERHPLVDFVFPFLYDHYRVMTHFKNTGIASQGTFFLTSFTRLVWAAIFSIIVLFALLKMMDRRFAPPDHTYTPPANQTGYQRFKYYILKSRILYRLRKAFMDASSNIIGMSSGVQRSRGNSTRQWVINFVITLFGLVLILSYEAKMT